MEHKRDDADLEKISDVAPLYAFFIIGILLMFIGGIGWAVYSVLT